MEKPFNGNVRRQGQDLEERLLIFAARVGKVVDALPDTKLGRHIAGQLVRSGTSPAPNYGEACAAESKKDFIHKLGIALKELRETCITSRFLNVMSLLAGSIPLVAIQLNALKVGDQIVLDFVKVLDQTALREDLPSEPLGETADRNTWEKRVGSEIIKLCDRIAEMANEVAEPKFELKYLKGRLGLCPHGNFFNFAALFPKKGFLSIRMGVTESDAWLAKLQDAGIEANSKKPGRITIRLRPSEMHEQEMILRELIHKAVREFQG